MLNRLLLALILLVASATHALAGALDAAERGREIFLQADERASGFGDLEVALRMTLRTAGGSSSERELRIRQLEVPADGDRVMVVFDTPPSIRGTALLSHGHPRAPDDQWLFLPAIKRVKKIASRKRSGPFLGSEFSFEDLSAQEVEKFTYEFLREAPCRDTDCYVVARVPLDKFSGYAREVFWIDQEHLRTLKVEYFDRNSKPVKVLEASDYRLYQDRFWKAHTMVMENLRTGKSTELHWQDFQFDQGLRADRDFSESSLRRAR
jgi:hypothetical protein